MQNQLTRIGYANLDSFAGSISSICDESDECDENDESETRSESEGRTQQIAEISKVYLARENTFYRMLTIYERMYSDIIATEKQRSKSNQSYK